MPRTVPHQLPSSKGETIMSVIQAEPFPLEFDAATTALVIIDMQRDFV